MTAPPVGKYRPYPTVDLPNRGWPSRVMTRAPIWCSVDLRDGNQALGKPMALEQKLAFFALLVRLGFKEIEVGFPSSADVEEQFVRTLIRDRLIPDDVTIQVMTPSRPELIDRTFDALAGARRAILHFFNPTSPTQRRVVFNLDRAGAVDLAVRAAAQVKARAEAAGGTEFVFQYSPESWTATELDFTVEICDRVLEVLTPTPQRKAHINLPATVEMSTPNVFADRIEWFGRQIRGRDRIVLGVHPHNDRGTGIAATELALLAGAERVEGTLFGNGERSGNVDLVTMALNLFTQGIDPELDLRDLNGVADVYRRCTGMSIHARHPYCGELVYTAFAGSHQDAIRKAIRARHAESDQRWDVPYLPLDPQDIGRSYQAIIRINSQSGKGGVAYVLEERFGYQLPRAMHAELGELIQEVTDESGEEAPFEVILRVFEDAYLRRALFDVQSTHIEAGPTGCRVMARVAVSGEAKEATGDGPTPAEAFCAGLRTALSTEIAVVQQHAHPRGRAGSEVVAYVQLQLAAGRFFGVGVDADADRAALAAVVSALDRAHACAPAPTERRQGGSRWIGPRALGI